MVEPAAVGEAEALVVSPVADGPATFEAAFDQVFAAAYRAAFRLLGEREEASDCAQEALTHAYPRWERLQRKGDPSPWVVHMAANLAIDRWRRQQRSDRPRPTAEATHVDDESVVTRAVLNAALAELPKRRARSSGASVRRRLLRGPGRVGARDLARRREATHVTGPRRAARPVGGQLMDLTHLDDVQPPVPDAAIRGHVVKTARSRRRTHVGLESAAARCIVVAAIASWPESQRSHGPGRHARRRGHRAGEFDHGCACRRHRADSMLEHDRRRPGRQRLRPRHLRRTRRPGTMTFPL